MEHIGQILDDEFVLEEAFGAEKNGQYGILVTKARTIDTSYPVALKIALSKEEIFA